MEEISKEKAILFYSLKVAIGFAVLCIVVHLIFLILPIHKYDWSIYPRDVGQIYGIITGQFIHASWGHLLTNIPPLLVSTWVLFYFYRSIGWSSFTLILMITGFMVFLFARNSSHIGASGLIYGLISFIFFSGIFRRNVKSIILMIIMVIMYSGYMAGFFPMEEKISWESHLFGAIAGLWTAFVFRNYREHDEEPIVFDWKGIDRAPAELYFPRDLFDKTLEERSREQELQNDETNESIIRDDR
jgi:membrane associated rhomboid family serine protease